MTLLEAVRSERQQCVRCGHKVETEQKFCARCLAKLSKPLSLIGGMPRINVEHVVNDKNKYPS